LGNFCAIFVQHWVISLSKKVLSHWEVENEQVLKKKKKKVKVKKFPRIPRLD
jgi:hypothetical protein